MKKITLKDVVEEAARQASEMPPAEHKAYKDELNYIVQSWKGVFPDELPKRAPVAEPDPNYRK